MDDKLKEEVNQFLMGKETEGINVLSIPKELQKYNVDEFNFDEDDGTVLVLSPNWMVELKTEVKDGVIAGLKFTEVFSRA
ncbi:hypothetical protein [Clostridium sp.]|jgi:hypothetical protein|uniref:hypothetical protein n=1 Tax=Clostridium sp. TaxID=1506 RepID=UPI002FDE5DBF